MFPQVIKFANRFLFWSTSLATALFFLLIMLNVFTRFALKSPILGSVELSRLFFVWACFLGAAICYYRNAHVVITFFVNYFTEKANNLLNIVIYILSLVFFLLVGFESIRLVSLLWETSLPITKISQSWLYVPVPMSMFFLILFTVHFMREQIILIKKK